MTFIPNYVSGYGPRDGPLLFVAEAPGATEDLEEKPLVGESGRFLDKHLREISKEILGYEVRLDDCYRTNVVKYRPPNNKLSRLGETGHTIEEGIPQLWQEIGDIKSNCIVPLGNLALNAVTGKGHFDRKKVEYTGIMQWRGSIIPTLHLDRKCVSTFHPAALLRALNNRESAGSKGGLDAKYKYIWRMDLARALEESLTPRYDVPTPHLEIVRDHVTLGRLIEKYKNEPIVAVDIEVINAIPICCGFAFNNWHGFSVPLLDVMSWQNYEGIPIHELERLWRGVAYILQNFKTIGQNYKFDHSLLSAVCRMPIPKVHADIMIMAHDLYPEWEKKLAFHQSLWTRHPHHKEDGKFFDRKRDNIKQYLLYNARDCVVTRELYDCFVQQADEISILGFPAWKDEFMMNYTMKLHDFYRRMENVGFKLNKEKQLELIDDYTERLRTTKIGLDAITGGKINYNSHPQIRRLLFKKQGEEGAFESSFGLPERESTDEDSLVAIAANNAKRPEHKAAIELILDYRRIRKALGTYFVAESDYDGRMRTNYRICGTETGRSATGILRPPVRPKKIGLAFQTLTKHGELGPEVRSEFEADEGYTIVETDMSQAEARIVALLGNDTKTLDLFARGEDIHSLTAKWIFGLSEDPATIKKRFPEFRFIGKTTRHAGNYDMQKARLMTIVNTEAKKAGIRISISEWKAGEILKQFHAFSPAIRKEFHPAVREALRENNMTLVNPFGRQRQFFGRPGDETDREAYAQIPQSTVPDHLRKAGMRVEDRINAAGLYREMTEFDSIFVLEAHDALIALIRTKFVPMYVQMIHEEIEVPIDFSRCTISRGSLVIPAESKVGTNYMECKADGCRGCKYLHEYKVPRVTLAA